MLELTYLAATSRIDRLSRRERRVLRLIAWGQSDALIASQLGVSTTTATGLVEQVFDTLGVHPTPYLSRRLIAVLTLRQVEHATAEGEVRRRVPPSAPSPSSAAGSGSRARAR